MPDAPLSPQELFDHLTAIRGRAQVTRRRVGRVERLSRDHIAEDLALIEARADALAEALRRLFPEPPRRRG